MRSAILTTLFLGFSLAVLPWLLKAEGGGQARRSQPLSWIDLRVLAAEEAGLDRQLEAISQFHEQVERAEADLVRGRPLYEVALELRDFLGEHHPGHLLRLREFVAGDSDAERVGRNLVQRMEGQENGSPDSVCDCAVVGVLRAELESPAFRQQCRQSE
jgi:hypothetical protein